MSAYGQIDSLCHLLEAKEEHLSHIMKAIAQLEEADSLLANRLPVVAREAVRIRTVTRRKTGVAGWLGGKRVYRSSNRRKGYGN